MEGCLNYVDQSHRDVLRMILSEHCNLESIYQFNLIRKFSSSKLLNKHNWTHPLIEIQLPMGKSGFYLSKKKFILFF